MASESSRRRGTPISDGLGADLNKLGSILASHTRGLDDYLRRQASRIDERQQSLLAESAELLLPMALNLEAMTAAELQDLCRQKGLRGWSRLRRDALLAFVQQQLATDLETGDLQTGPVESLGRAEPHPGAMPPPAQAAVAAAGDSRMERLLLLLLQHLGVSQQEVEAAWHGPDGPVPPRESGARGARRKRR